jgi:hypothetical protein
MKLIATMPRISQPEMWLDRRSLIMPLISPGQAPRRSIGGDWQPMACSGFLGLEAGCGLVTGAGLTQPGFW